MGLFSMNYNKPGPGVDPNEPRKKGVKRFFEILGRDFGSFVTLNLFFCLFFIFPMGVFVLTDIGILPEFGFILSVLVAVPMGGVFTTMVYCISKMLRDDPEYVMYDIKRKFKQNFKQSIIPGVLYVAYLFGQIFYWRRVAFAPPETMSLAMVILEGVAYIVIGMVAPYIFLQIAYIDLKLRQIAKNSLIISFANLPRSFMGAIMGNLAWFFFWTMFPISFIVFPIMLIFVFSISWLLCLMWVWPPVDKQFNIETTLREKYDKEFDERMAEKEENKRNGIE